jgi:fructokinase
LTVLCLGESIVDLICEKRLDDPLEADEFRPHPGGALANVAVAVARAGGESAVLGGVGDDPWGRWMLARFEREGVRTEWVATASGRPTPLAVVTFDRDGEPSFQVYGEGIEAMMLQAGERLDDALTESAALVFGSNTLVGDDERALTMRARDAATDSGLPVLFDPNLRPTRWESIDDAAAHCREACDGLFLVKATHDEGELLTGHADPAQAAEALCELGARIAVVTRGAQGAVMRGAASAEVGAPEVEVVAPMGAGDAFMGALAAGLAAVEWDAARAAEALEGAAAAGAAACTGWGAYT